MSVTRLRTLERELARLRADIAEEKNLHAQTRTVVEELNMICTDLKSAGGPPFVRSEAIRLLREDQAALRAEVERLTKDNADFAQWVACKMVNPEWDSFKKSLQVIDHWKARAERAEADLAHANREYATQAKCLNESTQQVADLEAERDSLAKDRERLDWLCRGWDGQSDEPQRIADANRYPNPTGFFRDAIDAAMKGTP
jgi:DNA repair exonuclease SbcCD ATPase subunit